MFFTHKRQTRINSITRPTSWKFATILSLMAVAIVGYLALNHARPSEAKATQRTPVESFNIGMKIAKHRVQLGKDTATNYRAGTFQSSDVQADGIQPAATQASVSALQQGLARPLSMTSEDFNGDGMQDLVVGYTSAAGGVLTLQPGNVEAISPQSPDVLANLREGIYPSPFLNDVDTFSLPESPDFLATGDFNADGHPDVVATARGGQTLYLFTGDGHGGLNESRQISLDGQVTAMTKGQFNERNGTTSLLIGVAGPDGASVEIFDQTSEGVIGSPEKFSLPSAATALTLARLDIDSAGDLAVAASNQLFVIHGANQADPYANAHAIEHYDLPYDVVGIAAGDFIFDRESKPKLALLSTDGAVHFMTPGPLDLRPYTNEELALRQRQRIKIRRGEADETSLIEMEKSMLQRPGAGNAWMEVESRYLGVIPTGASPQSLLTTTRDAGAMLDELLVLDSMGNKVQMVDKETDAARVEALRAIDSVDLGSAPVAVLTTRLSTDGRPGTVVLEQNQAAPGLLIPTANTFNVTSNADLPDDAPGNGTCHASNGLCTLRAAIMESNYRGSSNTINLLASTTYTLTQGPPDDEFDALSDDGTAGDLDILDLFRICSQLGGGNPAAGCPGVTLGGVALTSVTIAGGNINTTVIAMGNLSPAAGGLNPSVNHDRILDVNNFANPQFNVDVTLSNLTMQNGNAPHYETNATACGGGPCFYHTPGGAIQYDGIDNVSGNPLGTLTLTTCKITSNTADGQGGGVFALDDSLVVQTNSVVTLNSSTLGSGGGISYGGGNKVTTQTLSISNTTIGGAAAANTAPDTTAGNGAGVSSVGGSGATISNSTISNNVAGTQGGGLAFVNTVGIVLSNSTISSNTAKSHGGGIYTSARNGVTQAASTTTLTTDNVTGNTADSDTNGTGNGGGVYNLFGTLTVQTTSHIDGNTAFNGGGIFDTWTQNTNDLPGSVVVNTSSTIGQTGTGNTAKNNGGGIAIDVGGNSATTPKTGSVTLTSVTVQANTANSDNAAGGDGGGIHDNGNDSNFKITLSLDGATIDSNVANSGGGGGTGDGMFLNTGTVTGANTVSFNGDDTLNINGGTFTSTSGTLNLAGSFTRATAGTFTHNSGTVNFNGGGAQNINGTATSEAFNNFTVNKGGGTLTVGGSTTSLTMAGNVLLSAGGFTAGTATSINVTGGSWTNSGATFTPGSSVVSFTNTGAGQNINGTATTQTFNGITVAKTAQILAVGGGTTTLTLNGSMTLTSGTLDKGTATTINVAGDWTNNGGSFTNSSAGAVVFNGGGAQNLNGTAATQSFNNFTVSKGGGTLTGSGSTATLTLTGNLSITAGTFAAGTITTINDPGNWGNAGTFTAGSSTVNLTGNNNTQTLTGNTTFNNLTCNHTGTGNATASGSTLSVSGLMRVQSGTFISSSTFNNVQIDSGATLASDGGTINVSGNWTNNSGTFTPSTGTVNFNGGGAQTLGGTAATQSFNNFTVNKSGGSTLSGVASTTTLTVAGDVTITAGIFSAGTITTLNVAGNWANSGTFTSGSSTVVFNGNNSTQTLTGTTSFNNLTSNHTGTGGVTASGSSLTVTGLLRIQSGTFTSSSTLSNVQIDSGTTLASDGSTMNVSGNWTNNGGTFTANGNTVNFNGAGAQTLGGTAATQSFNNFTVNKSGGSTLSVGGSTTTLTLTGTVTLTAGTFAAGTATTTNVAGDWTNNSATTAFTAGAGTVNFNGSSGAQTISGSFSTSFNALTNSNGTGINMNNDNTVGGVLALTSSDITVAATKTLTQPSTAGASTGTFDVIGSIRRTGANLPNSALTYGNPDNVITLAGSTLTSLTVNLTKSVPTAANTGIANSGFPGAVQRTYIITEVPAGAFTPGGTTLQLHYLTTELNGNSEATPGPPASLRLFRYVVNNPGTGWQQQDFASNGANTTLSANHFVKVVGIKGFSPWTMANSSPTTATGSIGGTITDANGVPISGATINLSGAESRETITDSQGNYSFDNVETNGFYTVTPSRANYSFSPASRSFSALGVHTEASFTASPNGDNANAIDTTEFFVRQQYLDFLGREPDGPGFNGWVNTIRNCAAGNPSCDRVHVSEMFFRSAEFQERGYFVYRFYSTALGRKPDYAEFMPDMARVSGFLTDEQLAAAKTQFAGDFTARPAFVNQYGMLTNSQYVDALSASAGVSLSNRQSLIDSLNAGTMTRAQTLRQIAESNEVYAKYYNQAFVVMEYFGYLRRDPDALYLNWIQVLDANPTDSRRMVEGFVDATEYRNRFRQ